MQLARQGLGAVVRPGEALRSVDAEADLSVRLIELDTRLPSVLEVDGRGPHPQSARAVGWSESAVRRRMVPVVCIPGSAPVVA